MWFFVSCVAIAALNMVSPATVYEALGKHRDLSKVSERKVTKVL